MQQTISTLAVVGAISAIALNSDANTKALAVGALAGATAPFGGALVGAMPSRRISRRAGAISGELGNIPVREGSSFSDAETRDFET